MLNIKSIITLWTYLCWEPIRLQDSPVMDVIKGFIVPLQGEIKVLWSSPVQVFRLLSFKIQPACIIKKCYPSLDASLQMTKTRQDSTQSRLLLTPRLRVCTSFTEGHVSPLFNFGIIGRWNNFNKFGIIVLR